MKNIKFNKKQIIFLISICLILIIAIVSVMNKTEIIKFARKVLNLETKEITYEVYSNENNKIKLVVTVTDTENGIAEITDPDNDKLVCQGQNKVAFDYIIEENKEYTFTSISTTNEEKSITILVNDEFRENLIQISKIQEISTEQDYEVTKDVEECTWYYAIGENNTNWIEIPNYDKINVDAYKVLENNAQNEDGTTTLKVKRIGKDKNVVEIKKVITDLVVSSDIYNTTEQTLEGESIIACIQNNTITSGNYLLKVNGEEYPAEIYNYDENVNYVTDKNLGTAEADTRMLIMKYNGNLTVDTERLITAQTGKKGMFIYTEGTLTNNGEISMTERGAHAVGQDVYLLKHENGLYEYVPAVGGAGGKSTSVSAGSDWASLVAKANVGENGINRQTGGGSSGQASVSTGKVFHSSATAISGSGSTGTSYSGGLGGASASAYADAYTGSRSSVGASGQTNGGNYAGGLLILYQNEFDNTNGIISSNANNKGNGGNAGGSINIFYNKNINTGIITATGETGAGKGGDGCITLQDINIKSPTITASDITTNSFVINIENQNTENVTYNYYVNNVLKVENTSSTSETIDYLIDNTEYTVKVILKYEDMELQSNEITVTTSSFVGDINIQNNYNKIIYIDANSGNDLTGTGTKENPYATLDKISEYGIIQNEYTYAIVLGDGNYTFTNSMVGLTSNKNIDIIGNREQTRLYSELVCGTGSGIGTSAYKINLYRLILEDNTASSYEIFISNPISFYNVVFNYSYTPTFGYILPMTGENVCENCIMVNSTNFISQQISTSPMRLTNCYGKITSGYATTNNMWNYQTNYITSSPQLDTTTFEITASESVWLNTGTGTNIDGTQANLGVYGGIYDWRAEIDL